jgi:hypothetical protein
LTLWRAQYVSTTGALRHDTRARITWAISLFVDIVAGFWTFNVLSGNLGQWQTSGYLTLASHLWLLCLGTWVGISFFAILAVVSQGFGNDQAVLLMTIPVSPAARIIATLLVIRFVLPNLRRTFIVLAIGIMSIEAVFLLIRTSRYTLYVTFSVQIMPLLTSLFCVLLLLLFMGPLAGLLGTLYQQAFYTQEGRSGSRVVVMLPGMRTVISWLSRYRTLTGALLYKGLLNQSRNVFTWGRAAIFVICLALFPLFQRVMISYGFKPVAQVAVFSSIVAIIAVVEYATYAISSEGARMSYYVLAPFHMATYLRARLFVFLLPVLSIGLAVCIILNWWLRLPIYDTSMAALLVILLLVGYTACIVWGSAFDLDINQMAEGAMQTLMLEELPVTPRRLQLLGASTLLLVGMILLILKLPAVLSVFVLALLDVVVCVGLWRFSLVRLRGLV